MFKFKLNEVLKDRFTGYSGTVMGRAEYNTGCKKYALLPKELDEKGNIRGWEWLDESRVERADGLDESQTKKEEPVGGLDDSVPPEV